MRQRDGVRRAPAAEDAAASSAVVPATQNCERVRAAETVRGQRVGNPRRRPPDDDVIVDVFGYRMVLRNDFRNLLLTSGRDVEQGGLRLVELVGSRNRELANELIVKAEILTVDCAVMILVGRRRR